MLWVTGDGRKAALWLGLHGKPEQYPAKLDAIATQMATVYGRWQEQALAALHLPPPEAIVQPALFPEEVLAELEQPEGEQVSLPAHIPLTRDLWYPDQIFIAPLRCWLR